MDSKAMWAKLQDLRCLVVTFEMCELRIID